MRCCVNCYIAWDERDYKECPMCQQKEEIEKFEASIEQLEKEQT